MMMGNSISDQAAPAFTEPNGVFVPKRYARVDGVYWGSPDTATALEPGFYVPDRSMRGPMLSRLKTKTDDLLRLPDPTCDVLLKEFVDFWERAPQMIAHRR